MAIVSLLRTTLPTIAMYSLVLLSKNGASWAVVAPLINLVVCPKNLIPEPGRFFLIFSVLECFQRFGEHHVITLMKASLDCRL